MRDFIFVGYTVRERFNPNDELVYKENTNIENCDCLYTLDTGLLPKIPPFDKCTFEIYSGLTNRTVFSYDLDTMKKVLDSNKIILGCFIEKSAIESILVPFDDNEPLFQYAVSANKKIDSNFIFRGFEVISKNDYEMSANTNYGYTKDKLRKFGEVLECLLFANYEGAHKFNEYLNSIKGADHAPFCIWQIWSLEV